MLSSRHYTRIIIFFVLLKYFYAVPSIFNRLVFQSYVEVQIISDHCLVNISVFKTLPSVYSLAAPYLNVPSCHATLEANNFLNCTRLFSYEENFPVYEACLTIPISSLLPPQLTVNFWRTWDGSLAEGVQLDAWEVMFYGMPKVRHRIFLCKHQS